MKLITLPKINNKQAFGLLQWLALLSEQQHTELRQYFSLKSYRAQFGQKLGEEDFQNRVEDV